MWCGCGKSGVSTAPGARAMTTKTGKTFEEIQAERDEAVALLRKLSGPLAEEAELRSMGGDTPYSLSLDALTDEVDAFLGRVP